MDPRSRAPGKNTSHGNKVLPQDTMDLIQRPCYQRGSPCQDPAGNRTTRQTEEEMRRQHQGMERPGVRQVPEGGGEQGKIEETGCTIICGVPTTLVVQG